MCKRKYAQAYSHMDKSRNGSLGQFTDAAMQESGECITIL